MGGRVGSSWYLVAVACQGGTTITSSWPTSGWLIGDQPIGILPTCSPSTSGPIGRSAVSD
jgi:hypothetical protein